MTICEVKQLKMFLLVSDYRILLNITVKGNLRQRFYRLQKYYNVLSDKINISVSDETVGFDTTIKCDANKILYNTIIKNDKLENIEVYSHDLPCKYINYNGIECDKIILYNVLTNEYENLVPSKYGNNINQFITDNSCYNNKSHLTTELLNYITKIKQSRLVQSFIDEFNNNENIIKLKNIILNRSSASACQDCSQNTQKILEDVNYSLSNAIDEINENIEFDKNFTEEKFDEIEVIIANLKDELNTELMNMNLELSSFKSKPTLINNVITPENLIDQTVFYHKEAKMTSCDVIETIKDMLSSSRYTLSDDFNKNKLDFKSIQFKFKALVSPKTISRDDILTEVFNIDNTISLI